MTTGMLVGEIVECKFHLEAAGKGLLISLPRLVARYDCIVDNSEVLYKVQIKSTLKKLPKTNSYKINLFNRPKAKAYKANEVDIFAVYLSDIDLWYFIPYEVISEKKSIYIQPDQARCQFSAFKNYWDIFNNLEKIDSKFSGETISATPPADLI